MVDRMTSASQTVKRVLAVGGQVVRELKDPRQFLDPERRRALIENGMIALRGASIGHRQGDAEIAGITERIGDKVEIYHTTDGLQVLVETNTPVAAYIFPYGATIGYFNNTDPDHRRMPDGYVFTGPVFGYGRLPLHGVRRGEQVLSPLTERDPGSQIQHGGIVAHSNTIRALDWKELIKAWDDPDIPADAAVLQADWYMDSNNQGAVVSRHNIASQMNLFNSLGKLVYSDGRTQIIAISTYPRISDFLRRNNIPVTTSRTFLLSEVAAMANVAAIANGASSWRLCGMEFTNGGLMAPNPHDPNYLGDRDYFQITLPRTISK